NVVVDTTQALINSNVLLPAVQNVSLTANGGHTMTTYAENGAKTTTSTGDAITPVIAVAVSLVSSKADFAASSGPTTVLTGKLTETASQRATADTQAKGSATAAADALGISIAVTVAIHKVTATLERSITSVGLSLSATASSNTDAQATASATGSPAESSTGGSSTGESVDQTVADQRNFGEGESSDNLHTSDSGAPSTPSAKSSQSGGTPLQVAAAVAVNIAIVTQQASIADGLTVNAGIGDVSLNATGNTDAQAKADGSAVAASVTSGDPTANTVGAAVAINLAFPKTLATIGNGSLSAKNLSLTTGMTSAGSLADQQNDYDAEATSGAGGGKNSVAGSVALNLVLSNSEASVASGATLSLTGDATLSAASSSNSVAKALPAKGGASGGAFGLGL